MKKKIDIESLDRKNPHQVPDGYFDELPLKIQSRINNQQASSRGIHVIRMQLGWSLTAAVVIFLLGWFWYPDQGVSPTADDLLAGVDSADLIEYLYEEDISTDEILASIDGSYLIEEINTIESDFIDPELSEEDIESIYSELDYSTEI